MIEALRYPYQEELNHLCEEESNMNMKLFGVCPTFYISDCQPPVRTMAVFRLKLLNILIKKSDSRCLRNPDARQAGVCCPPPCKRWDMELLERAVLSAEGVLKDPADYRV